MIIFENMCIEKNFKLLKAFKKDLSKNNFKFYLYPLLPGASFPSLSKSFGPNFFKSFVCILMLKLIKISIFYFIIRAF